MRRKLRAAFSRGAQRGRGALPYPIFFVAIALSAAGGATGCHTAEEPPPRPHPVILVGIDGGEWRVIERLWARGELPHLRDLARRGVRSTLRTAYNSSPVIWTTIATGVTPLEHGITDFVVPTPRGDVPISSTLRKVPALWNMASRRGRRVAALGWWGSWPAEPVRGAVVSDRALLDLPGRVSPPGFLPRFLALAREAEAAPSGFRGDEEAQRRDRVMAHVAQRLAGEGFDLLLLYFRSPDVVSHADWRYFEPERFAAVDRRELAARRDRIPAVYRAADEALGRLLAAAPADANVLVVSDHGFHAARAEEETRVVLDLDIVLERLGFLVRHGGGVDFRRSRVYTYASPDFRRARFVRFALAGREPGGTVRPEDRGAVRRAAERALAGVTYAGGEPVFFVRPPRRREMEQGADFVVGVSPRGASETLLVAGRPLRGAVGEIARISGTHTRSTHGIFLAAGPDVDPAADLAGIRIHDLAPTVLYGMGLPVARDFAGKARIELFRPAFRERHPLAVIPTWGKRRASGPIASAADEALVEELRALGYLN